MAMPSRTIASTTIAPNARAESAGVGHESNERLYPSSHPINAHSTTSGQKASTIMNGFPNHPTSDAANGSAVSYGMSTNAPSTPALTYQNLTAHGCKLELVWNDPRKSFRLLREASDGMRLAVRSLGVDLPEHIMRKVVQKSDSMTPMERFMDVKNGQIASCAMKSGDEALPSPAVSRWDS